MGKILENIHPTKDEICAGCERHRKEDCLGKKCRDYLNPAGK